jgi:prolyl-tRNA synthetase
MRFREAFIYTLREDPAEAELVSHKLMLRAGMIQKLASGIYNYLPLGLRVIRKIENIIREEMNAAKATELLMPSIIPAELWQESGRWNFYGPELLRIKDRKNNMFCFGPTHEEVVVDVARKAVRSYRDLPLCLYQIQTKFRDEVRPRFGLMRGREFIMKDAYSFHADEQSLDDMYWRMHKAYTEIFRRCGLVFRPVEADSGAIGGDVTQEFHVLADSGEDVIVFCDSCQYAANLEKAASGSANVQAAVPAGAMAMEEVATPDKTSIEEVCAFLGAPASSLVKMIVYSVNEGEYLTAVCIRGDLAINEAKLRGLLKADSVSVPEMSVLAAKSNLTVGYLGAFGIDRNLVRTIIADNSVLQMSDCICGANKSGFHMKHVYPSRDLTIDTYSDVGFVAEGDKCPKCGNGTLKLRRGIEVGQVFKLGKKYSKPMNMTFLNEKGASETVTMGCYGIGVGRTAAAAIEQNHDANGMIWPVSIAPFSVVLISLDTGNAEVDALCLRMQNELQARGADVLIDDRDERPGVKFKDADLIGIPVRMVMGGKKMQPGTVEIKSRSGGKIEIVATENAVARVCEIIFPEKHAGG